MGEAPYAASMFLLRSAGRHRTETIRAPSNCALCVLEQAAVAMLSIVSTEEERDGMNNERGAEQQEGGRRRRKKDSWCQDWC